MTIRCQNFPLNQVLSFNKPIMPAMLIDCEPTSDRYEVAVKDAKSKITLMGIKANTMVENWNYANTKAIRLSVEKGQIDGIRIVGQWAECLTVEHYNQELDYHAVAEHIADNLIDNLEAIYPTLELICHFEQSVHTVIRNLKEAFFNSNQFAELRDTSFFKHINKIFDIERLTELFEEIGDSYSKPILYATDAEDLEAFKAILKLTFLTFIDERKRIASAVVGFELEQVCIASDKAQNITELCSAKPLNILRASDAE